jgi:hypothetical protein
MQRIFVTLLSVALLAATASADSADDAVNGIAVPIVGGTVKLDLRARYEHADADGFAPSNAETLRTRSATARSRGRGCPRTSRWRTSRPRPRLVLRRPPAQPRDRTPIADPSDTELNQAYAMIDRPDFGGPR